MKKSFLIIILGIFLVSIGYTIQADALSIVRTSFDKTGYEIGDTPVVTVTSAGANLDPNVIESMSIDLKVVVASGYAGVIIGSIPLTETGPNTGIFTGSSITINEGHMVHAASGLDNQFIQAVCARGCGGSAFTQANLIQPPEPEPEPEPEKQSSSSSYASVSGPFMCPKISDHTVQGTQNHVPSFEYYNCHYNNAQYGYPEGRIEISYLIDSVGVPDGWCTGDLRDESNINQYGGYTTAYLTSNTHQIFINISFGADDHDESIAAAKQMLHQMEINNEADSCSASSSTTKSEPKQEPKSSTDDDKKETTCPAGYKYLDMYGGVCAKIPSSDDTTKSDSEEKSREQQALDDQDRIDKFNQMMKEKEDKKKITLMEDYYEKGWRNLELGNYDSAILFLKKALQIFDTVNPDLVSFERDEIISDLKEAQELKNSEGKNLDELDFSGLLDKGNDYCHGDFDLEKAKPYYQKAIELDPNNSQGYYDMARCLYTKGEQKSSADYFYKLLELNPNDRSAVSHLLEMNLPIPEGSKEIAKNIQVDRLVSRGDSAIGDARYEAALSLLNQAKKIAPSEKIDSLIELANFKIDTRDQFKKCNTLKDNKKFDDAASCLQSLLVKAPEDTKVLQELAFVHIKNNKMDEFFSIATKWNEIDPNNPKIPGLYLGKLIAENDNKKYVLDELDSILEEYGNDPDFVYPASWLLLQYSDDVNGQYYKKYLELFEKANKLDPNSSWKAVIAVDDPKSFVYTIPTQKEKVPGWVKNNAKWWAEGQLEDEDFLNGIEHLVKEKIINIEDESDKEKENKETKKETESTPGRTLSPSAATKVDATKVLESSNFEIDVPQFWETKATDKSHLPERTYYSGWDSTWKRTMKLGMAHDVGQKINLESSNEVKQYIEDYEKQRCADSQLNPVFMEDNGGFDGYSTCLEFGSLTFKETTVNGLDAYQVSYEWKQKWRESDGYTEYPSWTHWENLIPYGDDLILVSGESVSNDVHRQKPIILDSINSFKILNDGQQIFDSDTSNQDQEPFSQRDEKVPDWIKTNAEWWANGQISEDDFINGIKYLVENGIVRVN